GTPPAEQPNGENAGVLGTAIEARIRELALSFPETYEDHPWGDFPVFKVGANKVFAWLTVEPKAVRLTLKLTAEEREIAHVLPSGNGEPEHLLVYEIGVRKDARRRGVGRTLMQRLAELAGERGVRDAFLLTNESNAGAMAFYQAIGCVRPNADDVLWSLRFG